jgi:exopolysaccharide production protein ExoZ
MGKIRSLEMLRAVAALLVVMFHTQTIFNPRDDDPPFWGIFSQGSRGVDLFFVLSGFIIAYVHGHDIGRPETLSKYGFNRLTRIYPAVWIVSVLALVPYSFGYGGAEKAGKLAWHSIMASVLLLPQTGVALVTVTWTLKYEMFFYALFAIAIVNRRAGLILLVLWQTATAAATLSGSDLGISGYYLRSISLDFGVGLTCACIVRLSGKGNPVIWLATAVAGTALFVSGMAYGALLSWAGVLCGVGAGGVVVGLVRLEQTVDFPVPNLFTLLGGASYAIYLVHYPVITMLYVALARLGVQTTDALCLTCAATGVIAGVVFDRAVDRPAQNWLRQQKSTVVPRIAKPRTMA